MFELKNKDFYRKTLVLMLPVILQQLISIGVNFMDNLMIGGFGETQIAAASFANEFYSLFQFICMGLGSGAVVMSSQFWGRHELEPMRVTAAIGMRITLILCAVFTVFSQTAPQLVMKFFTNDAAVISVGAPYMKLIGVTFIMSGLSSEATYLLRSVGNVKVSLIGSISAFVLNIFFNWVFIFGKFGAPRLELVGAAVGTVIARAVEFIIVFGYFAFAEKSFGFRLKHFALSGKMLSKQFFKYSLPVMISDTLLGLSLSLLGVIGGHVGAAFAAASAIVGSIVRLTSVINSGMAGASAVVIGNTIGEGDIAKAKREGNSYCVIAFLFGLILIVPLMLLEKPYFSMYTIEAETQTIAHAMLLCNCLMLPIQMIAFVTSKGILRGGGDTRFLLIADSSLVWFVSIPLGALAGLVWHLPAFWVYFLLHVEYPAKGIVCFIRYLTGKWIKEIKVSEKA